MLKVMIAAMLALLAIFSAAFAAMDPNRIVTEVDYVSKTFSSQAKAGSRAIHIKPRRRQYSE